MNIDHSDLGQGRVITLGKFLRVSTASILPSLCQDSQFLKRFKVRLNICAGITQGEPTYKLSDVSRGGKDFLNCLI